MPSPGSWLPEVLSAHLGRLPTSNAVAHSRMSVPAATDALPLSRQAGKTRRQRRPEDLVAERCGESPCLNPGGEYLGTVAPRVLWRPSSGIMAGQPVEPDPHGGGVDLYIRIQVAANRFRRRGFGASHRPRDWKSDGLGGVPRELPQVPIWRPVAAETRRVRWSSCGLTAVRKRHRARRRGGIRI